ncbi:MAG: hypothetical protein MJK04_37060 [Psychrosphaera sp.]|nr:hypothetical protein [Psychrosphaera sp.]
MKIQKKMVSLLLAMGVGVGFSGISVAQSTSNCCMKICGKYPHPPIVQACLSDCVDTYNGCYLR